MEPSGRTFPVTLIFTLFILIDACSCIHPFSLRHGIPLQLIHFPTHELVVSRFSIILTLLSLIILVCLEEHMYPSFSRI